MDYLAELNEKQYEAVSTESQFVRVVAGAGSGKTRVLTYRISYLISEFGVKPWEILAITFTNKVANEMKTRVAKMIPDSEKYLTIKTFHSFAAYFLRKEIDAINFPSCFTILDEEDQTKIVKDIVFEMGYKRNDKIVASAINYISYNKLHEKYPEDITIVQPKFPDERTCLEIYTRYEEIKNRNISLDFDDLLLKSNYILETYPQIRVKWQNRVSHILVDEFQDTNDVEYKFIKLLSNVRTSLYVVGDPDQTIYTWRGANQNIILNLEKEYKGIVTIVLDRNYRSTQNILDSANKLIDYNKQRVKKNLYTSKGKGEPIIVRSASDDKEEAEFVVREISNFVKSGSYTYSDIAILYRSNYITLNFENALVASGIPYKIYGGMKFYQRREIKDCLAYFHLIVNTKDDLSFERIINVPRRGIGESSIDIIKLEARGCNKSIYDYISDVAVENSNLPSRVINSLKSMITLIETTRNKINSEEEVYVKNLDEMIVSLGYFDYLLKDDDSDERIENVKALIEDIRHFLKVHPDSKFEDYLQNVSLLSAQDDIVNGNNVSLMTVHTAKGLEYPIVFIVRLNQGVFPNNRALLEDGLKAMEEERRLAYVAMTRAKEKLYLTLSKGYSFVQKEEQKASQFLLESGNQSKEIYPPKFTGVSNVKKPYFFDDGKHCDYENQEKYKQNFETETNGLDESDWKVGDIVVHKTFGNGVLIAFEGDGIITVDFTRHGVKSIMCNHPFVKKGVN